MELNFQTLSPAGGRAKRVMMYHTAYLYSVCILQHVDVIIFCLAQLVAKILMLDYQGVKVVSEFGKKSFCGFNGKIAHGSNSALARKSEPVHAMKGPICGSSEVSSHITRFTACSWHAFDTDYRLIWPQQPASLPRRGAPIRATSVQCTTPALISSRDWASGVWVPVRLHLAIICLFIILYEVQVSIQGSCVNFLSLARLESVIAMM